MTDTCYFAETVYEVKLSPAKDFNDYTINNRRLRGGDFAFGHEGQATPFAAAVVGANQALTQVGLQQPAEFEKKRLAGDNLAGSGGGSTVGEEQYLDGRCALVKDKAGAVDGGGGRERSPIGAKGEVLGEAIGAVAMEPEGAGQGGGFAPIGVDGGGCAVPFAEQGFHGQRGALGGRGAFAMFADEGNLGEFAGFVEELRHAEAAIARGAIGVSFNES